MFKFIHTADIHIDSPLRGLERYEGAPVEEIRSATRQAFRNLVDLAIAETASFVLIAGDIYDSDWKDYNTGLFFVSQLARLSREGIRVVIIRGNHDAASQITKSLRLPENVFELSTKKAETKRFDDIGVAIHGQSYPKRDVTDDLSSRYPPALKDHFNIGILHTALDGREGHDLYAPCRTEGLVAKGYDYWALGHVHKREVVSESPLIIFPGNLQGRHAKEFGPKGPVLVRVEGGEVTTVEYPELDIVRWVQCDVDIRDAASGYDMVDLVRDAIGKEGLNAEGRTLAARLRVTGNSRAHKDISSDPEQWSNQIRAAVADLGINIWVEKIIFSTKSTLDIEKLLIQDDPISNLLRNLRDLRQKPDELTQLLKEFDDLKIKLPPEYRQADDTLNLGDPSAIIPLLDDIEQILIPIILETGQD
jgi:DNA repair protein SbcD/Mre11